MKFIYHDLKIGVLNKADHDKHGIREGVLTLVANKLVIKNSNPEKNKAPRITEINYLRNPQRFIFNYVYHSLLSGIKPAIGLSSKKSEK